MAARAQYIDRVVLFGPSHFAALDRIGTTHADEFETPLGNIAIDKEVQRYLVDASRSYGDDFVIKGVKKEVEEEEHSLEAHLPFIKKVFNDAGRSDALKLVPLTVGDLKGPKL